MLCSETSDLELGMLLECVYWEGKSPPGQREGHHWAELGHGLPKNSVTEADR